MMERERLGHVLSLALVGLGGILTVLSIAEGRTSGVALGVLVIFAAVMCFRWSEQLFDPDTDSITFDPTDTRVLTVNLLQLGLALLVFVLLTFVFSDIELLVKSLQTGIQAPTYLLSISVLIGLLLGGGVAILTSRWNRLQDANQSIMGRTVGFSATFGTYLLLLFTHLQATLVYAVVYTLSRLLALFGLRWWTE